MRYFALGFALFAVAAAATVGGRLSAPAPVVKHDSPQARDAIALVSANIGAAVDNYNLEWDNPPHVLSVTARGGDSVVVEEVRMSTNSYNDTVPPKHIRFVIRGVVSPLNWLRSLKVVSHKELKVPKPDKR